jgi:diguanylate cyclase (GGDEF)-like protein
MNTTTKNGEQHMSQNNGQKKHRWAQAGVLACSLALGVAIAAGVDTWGVDPEAAATGVWANGAIEAALLALASVAALLLYQWQTRRARAALPALSAASVIDFPAPSVHEIDGHARSQALLSTMDAGILFLSVNQRVEYCNPAFLNLWKVPSVPGIIGADRDTLCSIIGGALALPGEQSRLLLCSPEPDGTRTKLDLPMADGRLLTQQSHAVVDAHGMPLGRLWVFDDVTAERRNAKQLIQFAERDVLTGLYNRRRFNEEIVRMMADAQRHSSRLALLFFDLDGLKQINDTYGHRAGDAVLRRVALEVSGQVRRNEIFARLGGDEFVILAPDAAGEVPKMLAERLTRAVSQLGIAFEAQSLRVSCSCGIAVYPDNATTPDDLLACADAAMYQAKTAGKNTWRIYRTAAGAEFPAVLPRSKDEHVQYALENGLLTLHYQGIYATRGRALRHYEVLLRVRDQHNPELLLAPAEFIAMAEKCGRIVEVDRWVLSRAIAQLALHPAIPRLAVNISGRSLDDAQLPGYIESELQRHGVVAQRLQVELTETAAVSDLDDARRFIEALQALGCGVSLDDFGTGFASFAYLKHLQVDSIKIDGLFIRDLPRDRENQLFVKAIIAVARGLHKTTIAECVEDEGTLKILARLGVDYVQGFYLEEPHAEAANGTNGTNGAWGPAGGQSGRGARRTAPVYHVAG